MLWRRNALLFYFGSEHFCSFLFVSTQFRYCIYQSEEALIACNVKRENFISVGLSENAHGENPYKKKKLFTKWAQVPSKKNVIFARGAELLIPTPAWCHNKLVVIVHGGKC